jgi:hypothetical protein
MQFKEKATQDAHLKAAAPRPDHRLSVVAALLRRRLTLAVFRGGLLRFGKGLLRGFMSLIGVLHGLARMFVAAHVIFFVMGGGCGAMRVRGHFVKLRCACVVSVWHNDLLRFETYELLLVHFPDTQKREPYPSQ